MPGPFVLSPEFVERHNLLLTEERGQARRLSRAASGQRAAQRLRRQYREAPWTRPEVQTALSKIEEAGGQHARQAFRSEWADAGFSLDRQTLKQLEQYAQSADFAADVKERAEGDRSFWDKATSFAGDVLTKHNPIAGVVRGIGKAKEGDLFGAAGEVASGSLPGIRESQQLQEAVQIPNVPGYKPAVRAGLTALESPYQELQAATTRFALGTVGDPASFLTGRIENEDVRRGGERLDVKVTDPSIRAHSTGGIALGKLLRGEDVDLGEGFFPGGEIREEQMRRARELGSIEGRSATPGRILASTVVEPGSRPYNVLSGAVDAAMIWYVDPTNVALGGVGKVARAKRTISAPVEAVGGVRSWGRRLVSGPPTQEFLDSAAGQQTIDRLSRLNGEEGALELLERTKWKWPTDVVVRVLDETERSRIRGILESELGTRIPDVPHLNSVATEVRLGASRYKMAQNLPEQGIKMSRPEHATQQLYRHMKNVKVPDDVISRELYRFMTARAAPGDYAALTATLRAEEAVLVAKGVPRSEARQVLRFAGDPLTIDARQGYIDEIAEQTAIGRGIVTDRPYELPTSHFYSEHLNDEIALPSTGAINRVVNKYSGIWGLPKTESLKGLRHAAWESKSFLEHVQSSLWVPLVLLRGAWTVRVVGEEQVRMAASGLSSLFNHPMSHIAWAAGAPAQGKIGRGAVRVAEATPGLKQLRQTGIARRGGIFDDDLLELYDGVNALSKGHGTFTGDVGARVVAKGQRVVGRDDPAQPLAWADEIIRTHRDPIGQKVSDAMLDDSLDDLKEAFSNGNLQGFRHDLMESPKYAEMLADGNRAGADFYIDSYVTRIRMSSGGNRELVATMATGKYGDEAAKVVPQGPKGQRFDKAGKPVTKGVGVDPDFVKFLDQTLPENRPEKLLGDVVATSKEKTEVLDRAVDGLFGFLMTKPTNWLSRSPTFRQFYWERVESLFPYLDDASRSTVLARAGEAKLPARLRRQLSAADDAAKGAVGKIDLELADELAKGHGLDSTRDLLYDLNKRSQFFDATRLLFPFGEAWKEVLTRWARIGVERPQVVRRAQVLIDGARESNPFELVPGAMSGPWSTDDPSAQGFFFVDPETNEEVFAYPWTAKINEALPMIGVPIPMVGRAQGLNLALNLFPGVGPAVQIPAQVFMDRWMDDPKWDPVREFISPFGEADLSQGGIISTFAPAWMRHWFRSSEILNPWNPDVAPTGESARVLNNTIMDVAAYLVSTGDYNMKTPEAMNRTLREAESRARWLYVMRGTMAFGAPSAPSPRMVLEDKEGRLIRLQLARDEYYKLIEKDPSTANARFLERFGEDIFYATAAKTKSEVFSAPVTDEALQWARENEWAERNYPLTYGLFAPEGGEFDYNAYLRQLATGQRRPLSAREWAEGTNAMLGEIWYDRGREKLGLEPDEQGSEQERRWLARLEETIADEYPGFRRRPLEASKVPGAIEELREAAQDDRLPAAVREPIELYLSQREKAISKAVAGGSIDHFDDPAFSSAERNRPIREWLRRQSRIIVDGYPRFQMFWDRIFSREMDED